MTLAFTQIGDGPRIVLLHGFTQNRFCWGDIPAALATRYEVLLVDAPGHGRSYYDEATLWDTAELVAEIGGPAHYVGYSMGGRTALHLALTRPELVNSLVLIGATPGLVTDEERDTRRAADDALADRLDGIAAARAAGDEAPFEAFLTEWLSQPLFSSLPPASWCLEARRMNRPEGLAAGLRHCGTGVQDSLWDRLGELAMPVRLVAGSLDTKFSDLARAMAERIGPNAEVRIEPGSHAVHLEAPAGAEGDDGGVIGRALASLQFV